VAPLHGAAAAHHHAGAASREFNLGEATPIGDDGEAIDDLDQGRVIGCEWQVGRQTNAAAALPLSWPRRHVLHWSGGCWQRAFDESRWIARCESLNGRCGRWRYVAQWHNLRCVAARAACRIARCLKGTTCALLQSNASLLRH
jgi:hypothetical protein